MNGLLYQLFSVPSIERVYHWMALVPLLTTKINFRLMLCLKMIQFASWLWLFFGANIETCDERRNNLLYLEAFVIYMIIISDLKLRRRFLFSCIFLMCTTIDQNTRDSRTPTMRAQPLQIVFRSHDGFQNGKSHVCTLPAVPSFIFLSSDLICSWFYTNCTSFKKCNIFFQGLWMKGKKRRHFFRKFDPNGFRGGELSVRLIR